MLWSVITLYTAHTLHVMYSVVIRPRLFVRLGFVMEQKVLILRCLCFCQPFVTFFYFRFLQKVVLQ